MIKGQDKTKCCHLQTCSTIQRTQIHMHMNESSCSLIDWKKYNRGMTESVYFETI